jgi:hypothetical protein
MHRHRLDAELAAGLDDAQRDLAAVRDQDLLEHARSPPRRTTRGADLVAASSVLDAEERLAELDRLGVLGVDLLHHARDVGLDLVHQLHGLDDAHHLALLHAVADADVRLGVGTGAA